MALIKADRVKETSTSETTANFILGGAATGYRTFSSVCAVGDTFYYAISNQSNGEWEVGLGTYGVPNILERTTVHASSNAGNKVNFSSGTKECFISATKAWLDTFVTQTSGTTNYVAKTTGTGTIGNSQIFDNGTSVGIGTASPSDKLEVIGASNKGVKIGATAGSFDNTSYNPDISTLGAVISLQTGADSTYRQSIYGYQDASANAKLGIFSRSDLVFSVYKGLSADGRSMVIKETTGNVGIGTTSPAGKLHVKSSSISSWVIYAANSTGNFIGGFYENINGHGSLYVANSSGTYQAVLSSTGGSFVLGDLGVGTSSPGAQLQVTTAAAATKGLIVKGASGQSARYIELQDNTGTVIAGVNSAGMGEFNGVYSGENGKVQGFNGIELQAWNAGAMRSAAYVYKDLNMQIGGTITPNVNIGSNQLLVVNSSPSWAALRVKGASGQSANLQEWQNSSGIVLASISSSGNAVLSSTSASDPIIYQLTQTGGNTYGAIGINRNTGDGVAVGLASALVIRSGDATGYPIQFATANNVRATIDASGNVGIGTASPAGQLHTQATASGTKALVVRGASGQSANLQEWQNNSGTALAYISAGGIAVLPDIYAQSISDTNGVGYYKEYYFTRTLPDTVGDYVEFLEYAHTVGTRFKIDVMAADYPYWDSATYEFNSIWDNGSYIMPPKFRYHRNTSDMVLEKVHGQSNPYTSRLRLRRIGAKSSAGSTTVRIRVEVWASQIGGLPTDASATGTSSITSIGSDQSFCNTVLQVPPQLLSGNGYDLGIYAGNANGTGNGGSILLQAGAYATSGSNGKVIVRGLASNTANLQEWQNNAGSTLSAVKADGSIQPASLADSAATNNSIYYSTTAGKLVYKDSSGTVNNLY